MDIGVSTACFYPLETELALEKLGEAGIKTVEIFFNSTSEIESGFIRKMRSILDFYGMKLNSVHPFLAFGESYLLFSDYERRFYDTLDILRRFYDVARELDSKIVIIHGEKKPERIADEKYIDRFRIMAEEGQKQDVFVTQENVVNFRSEEPEFLKKMRAGMGELFKMTLDLKQSRRAGLTPYDFLHEFKDDIINVHISDYMPENDCLAPGKGIFDFGHFFTELSACGYNGNCIIELYRHNFGSIDELTAAADYVNKSLYN